MAGDRHRHIDRVDRKAAVRHVERHRAEVVVRVRELGGRQVHIRRTGIRSGGCGVAAEREVAHRVQRVAGLHVIAAHAVGRAVVVNLAGMAGDRHRHIDRIDRKAAVRHVERHVEVAVVVAELGCCKTHVSRAGVRSGCRGRAGEANKRLAVHRVVAGQVVARHGMALAVIRHRGRVTCHGDRHRGRRDYQPAVLNLERYIKHRVGVLKLFG